MASEQSFHDRTQRAGELHAAVSLLNPAYAPSDRLFTLTSLAQTNAAAIEANAEVERKREPYRDLAGDRASLVKQIPPLVTHALAYVKSNTSWASRFEALKKSADKVRGFRTRPGAGRDPAADQKIRESGERSYVEIAAHFKSFLDRLDKLPNYTPVDPKISVDTLSLLQSKLEDFNGQIPLASHALAVAISNRRQAFLGEGKLKFVFDGVKASVKGQYGPYSPNFKTVKGKRW